MSFSKNALIGAAIAAGAAFLGSLGVAWQDYAISASELQAAGVAAFVAAWAYVKKPA